MKKVLGLCALVLFTTPGCYDEPDTSSVAPSGTTTTTIPLTPDGLPVGEDSCPATQNLPDQSTWPGNDLPVACDSREDCPVGPQVGFAGQERNAPVFCWDGWCQIQSDWPDKDGIGDPCDEDDDNDGLVDESDNCARVFNDVQSDADTDGAGDACDEDDDNDGLVDESDNCSLVVNPGQDDLDHDGVGDACEGDTDGDAFNDPVDNCPLVVNPGQDDLDDDGLGDLCDADADGDGQIDLDNCPDVANADQADTDRDGVGDACDDDDDGDTVSDVEDNCPLIANRGQDDLDDDRVGDVCEGDTDGDEVDDVNDNCPLIPNADQANLDGDAAGNRCDKDCDDDGVDEVDDDMANNFCDIAADDMDLDADGFSRANGDCNDGNPAVAPNRNELCGNDVDENCNGRMDDVEVCGGQPPAECDNDAVCGVGRECSDVGECQDIPGFCDADGDCSIDQVCNMETNRCTDPPSPPGCGEGQLCGPDFVCLAGECMARGNGPCGPFVVHTTPEQGPGAAPQPYFEWYPARNPSPPVRWGWLPVGIQRSQPGECSNVPYDFGPGSMCETPFGLSPLVEGLPCSWNTPGAN